jgi:hypothetical protein
VFILAQAKEFCPEARMEVDFPFIDHIFSGLLDLMHHTLTTGGMELEVIFMLSYSFSICQCFSHAVGYLTLF